MKISRILVAGILLGTYLFLSTGCAGRSKGTKLAMNLLQGSSFESLSRYIEFTSFSPAGSSAIAEGTVTTGFRFEKENGRWVLKEVRLGELQWENVQDFKEALDNVKARRTRQEMQEILQAAARYAAQKGTYPEASDFVDLADKLTPDYLKRVIRLDGWHNEYRARTENGRLTIISNGPDGLPDTPDDIRMP
ncbi:MAG TPA: type II secretion system protein GspG [Acidobacteriota bacterium]